LGHRGGDPPDAVRKESGRAGDVNTNRPPSLEKIEIVEYGTRIVVITSTTSLMGDENKPIEIIIGKPI
jgi:hypothetical protein